jgi:hypothetical protein
MRVTVIRCARCGKTHKDIEFKRIPNPPPHWEWWALCPVRKAPILSHRVTRKVPR